MESIDEIKSLITLAGSRRLPDLEQEIFANQELVQLYLHTLCEVDSTSQNWSFLAYHYATVRMQARWPEAEHIIYANVSIAYYYNKRFKLIP